MKEAEQWKRDVAATRKMLFGNREPIKSIKQQKMSAIDFRKFLHENFDQKKGNGW